MSKQPVVRESDRIAALEAERDARTRELASWRDQYLASADQRDQLRTERDAYAAQVEALKERELKALVQVAHLSIQLQTARLNLEWTAKYGNRHPGKRHKEDAAKVLLQIDDPAAILDERDKDVRRKALAEAAEHCDYEANGAGYTSHATLREMAEASE